MKKIWIINHYADPPGDGKYLRHFRFAKELIKRNHDVRIFTASTIHNTNINLADKGEIIEKDYEGVPYTIIGCRNYSSMKIRVLNMLDYYFGVKKAVKNYEKPDVIYASSPHPLSWWLAYKLSKKYKAKFVVESRDLWPETFVSMGKFKKNNPIIKILYKLEMKMFEKADSLIFTVAGGKKYLEEKNIKQNNVFYINNGIDLENFNKEKATDIVENPILEKKDTFKVLYTGAMGRINDVLILLKAAKIIKDMNIKDIEFILYGGGDNKAELETYKAEHNLTNVFFQERIQKKYIPYILSVSDLNIITGKEIDLYKYGISLNKMFEYFASGVPVVSNLKCDYDIIEKYKCGETVETNSPEALAKGIVKYYNMDKEEYDEKSKNALETAKLFDFKVLTDSLEKALF